MKTTECDGELSYGCLKCRSGSEEQVIEEIRERLPGVNAVVARPRFIVCKDGVHSVDREILFPGYVYFSACGDFDIRRLLKIRGVKDILFNPDGSWMLRGGDRELAALLFSRERFNNIFL